MSEKTLHNHLLEIQRELKAPKGQYNSFGKYKYRSCEDIVEAVKPLAHARGCVLVFRDEIIEVGARIYVKSTASLCDAEGAIGCSAYAREDENKKGMDGAQLTGACSSYARKYAANALFAIDDTKDADATNKHGKEAEKPAGPTKKQQDEYNDFLTKCLGYESKATELLRGAKLIDRGQEYDDLDEAKAGSILKNASFWKKLHG